MPSSGITFDDLWQQEVDFDIVLAVLGMFVWDMLINLPADYRLLVKCDFKVSTLVYFFSRICCLGMLVTGLFLGNIGADSSKDGNSFINCRITSTMVTTFYYLSTVSTTFLFFCRARAVYSQSNFAQSLLLLLWLMNAGTGAMDFFLVRGVHISVPQAPSTIQIGAPATKEYCVLTDLRPEYAVVSALGTLIHDTVVFFVISHRLMVNNHLSDTGDLREKTVTFFSGRRMLMFSRMILRDGQMYYFISLLSTILVVILLTVPSIGTAIRLALITPHLTLVNALTCYVYRRVRFGRYPEPACSAGSPGHTVVMISSHKILV